MAQAILPVEKELLKVTFWQNSFPSVSNRLQSDHLKEDLRVLGAEEILTLESPLCMNSLEEAAGVLYVLEGSANGAMFLSKRIQASLNLNETSGLKYFLESARNAKERWKGFKSELNSVIQSSDQKRTMTRAAMAMFKLFLTNRV
jgi:heme oxygenase